MHVVDGQCDVHVPSQQVPGTGRRAVGGHGHVSGAGRDVQVPLPDLHHGHVVGAEVGRVVQPDPRIVRPAGHLLGVVPMGLRAGEGEEGR